MAIPQLSSSLRTAGIGLVTLLIWAVAAGTGTMWGLRLSGTSGSSDVAPPATTHVTPPIDVTLVAKALGALGTPAAASSSAAAAPPPSAGRFALQGVILGGTGQGVAVISVDGKPAKAVRVGSKVTDGVVLSRVHTRSAELTGESGRAFTVEMPKPGTPAATNGPSTAPNGGPLPPGLAMPPGMPPSR